MVPLVLEEEEEVQWEVLDMVSLVLDDEEEVQKGFLSMVLWVLEEELEEASLVEVPWEPSLGKSVVPFHLVYLLERIPLEWAYPV